MPIYEHMEIVKAGACELFFDRFFVYRYFWGIEHNGAKINTRNQTGFSESKMSKMVIE